jgi:hypothetical protein
VNERRDDTTPAAPESRRAPGSYYYDDATGYEVFDPEAEEEAEEEAEGEAGGGPGDAAESPARRPTPPDTPQRPRRPPVSRRRSESV